MRKNLVLLGMMGVGKSTLGKIVAKKQSLKFIDTDLNIEKKYSMKISEIFKEKGEEFSQRDCRASPRVNARAVRTKTISTPDSGNRASKRWSSVDLGIDRESLFKRGFLVWLARSKTGQALCLARRAGP